MVAVGQLSFLLDSKGKKRKEAISNADADREKVGVLRGLVHEFESRYLKSRDTFIIFGLKKSKTFTVFATLCFERSFRSIRPTFLSTEVCLKQPSE